MKSFNCTLTPYYWCPYIKGKDSPGGKMMWLDKIHISSTSQERSLRKSQSCWSWTSSFQDREAIHFCSSHLVTGTLLQQPKQTIIDGVSIGEQVIKIWWIIIGKKKIQAPSTVISQKICWQSLTKLARFGYFVLSWTPSVGIFFTLEVTLYPQIRIKLEVLSWVWIGTRAGLPDPGLSRCHDFQTDQRTPGVAQCACPLDVRKSIWGQGPGPEL